MSITRADLPSALRGPISLNRGVAADNRVHPIPYNIVHSAAISPGEGGSRYSDRGYDVSDADGAGSSEAIRRARREVALCAAARLHILHRRLRAPSLRRSAMSSSPTAHLPMARKKRSANYCVRLFAARLLRWHRHPLADDLHQAGKPNKAASGFFSNILREPLAGHEAVLPVDDMVRHWHASPRAASHSCFMR